MLRMLVCSKVLVMGLLLGGGSITVAGCNTIAGAGEDVSAAGRGVSRGARNVRDRM